ncbi:MAG: diacylglycerol kinase family protein [Ruminococcus sp.]|nr:diacylglycerol kinase family protein [Ruminococcus sp.]MCM1479589.1 diacylglycerol kinase family protein [Muribaculaceae bacterium]
MKKFFKAFVYAGRGVAYAVRTQRNFRFHIAAAVYVTAFSFFYELTRGEYVLLALTFSAVMSAELVNTAVEAAVDLISPEKNRLAAIAKDAAAGAVLVTAFFAVIVGVLLFGDIAVIKEIFGYYSSHPLALVGLVCSLGLAWGFVFKWGNSQSK